MEKEPGEMLCQAAIYGDCDGIQDLIAAGADPAYFDFQGLTPLMHAANRGHTAAVRCLLKAGAPWNALSPSKLTAGDLAKENSYQEAYDLILNYAVQSELNRGTIARKGNKKGDDFDAKYLKERVEFSQDRLPLQSKAVMMLWELPLMDAHANAICGDGGGKILNIGFGMGLIDEAIQRLGPAEHTIVEADPGVYERMMKLGWGEKKNVKIIFGPWQEVLFRLETYDGIFFDTYGEYYKDLRKFHMHLRKLLKHGGIYSYYNGFYGGNAFFHKVYCWLVSLELADLGYSTKFVRLPIKGCLREGVWELVRDKCWRLDTYYLPMSYDATLDD